MIGVRDGVVASTTIELTPWIVADVTMRWREADSPPRYDPRVQFAVAVPWEFVRTESGLTDPLKSGSDTENRTMTSGTGSPVGSVTRTTIGLPRACRSRPA